MIIGIRTSDYSILLFKVHGWPFLRRFPKNFWEQQLKIPGIILAELGRIGPNRLRESIPHQKLTQKSLLSQNLSVI